MSTKRESIAATYRQAEFTTVSATHMSTISNTFQPTIGVSVATALTESDDAAEPGPY